MPHGTLGWPHPPTNGTVDVSGTGTVATTGTVRLRQGLQVGLPHGVLGYPHPPTSWGMDVAGTACVEPHPGHGAAVLVVTTVGAGVYATCAGAGSCTTGRQ